MSFDDPNREAVGLDPIWSGATEGGGGGVEPFDPSAHTVDEVNAYLEDHPEAFDDVLAAERAGKARVGILGE